MKNIISVFFSITAIVSFASAQNDIKLNINHKLADTDFALNQSAKNNMDHDFTLTRLEYYISEISLIHDGGQETNVEDTWILVNAGEDVNTEVELGSYDISNLERIVFHIGVDPEHNHLDPSSYPSSHPLAPKAPSMHWGWAAGYRFVALEGYGGTDLNRRIELHGLGDNNYFNTFVDLNETVEDNQLTINLDADYSKALENVSINSGVIVHGDYGEAKDCLNNLGRLVFSKSDITSSIHNPTVVNLFDIYPNPVNTGKASIKVDLNQSVNNLTLQLTNLDGRLLQEFIVHSEEQQMDVSALVRGVYVISLVSDGQLVATKRLIVE